MKRALLTLALLLCAAPVCAQSMNVNPPGPFLDAKTGTVTTDTTTLLVSGVVNESLFLWSVQVQSQGTNTAATFKLVSGQGATCGTAQVAMGPTVTTSFTAAESFWLSGASATGTSSGGPNPATSPAVVASGATAVNVCVITGGTVNAIVYTAYGIGS